ncbi:hypothetical protein FLL45_22125 [Aliikangiella marina]|uniref:DUF885 domain-containing protein n=1 Tax=Aliikangiella marina TaxID=1712262 RepID=A0A545T1C5_9GAMM|nr:hypothetical protein [Aliikangiella marina]TQV71026.1 hypothetical protein FLL45_22125 [Aliikangiella marina]
MKKTTLFLLLTLLIVLPCKAESLLDEAAKQYVQLALALGEHDPNYVDAYYGPDAWREHAKQKAIDLKSIVIAAKNVQDVVKQHTSDDEMIQLRIAYLDAQLTALSSKALMLLGSAKFDFDQQSQALYGTQAPQNDLKSYREVLSKLDKLLPGDGSLSRRVEKFKSQFVIPRDKLKTVFDVAIKGCRDRTKQFIELLENESFELEFVTDKPWSGYNWYKGNAFSLIQMNVELPIDISRAIDLGCHEGYPGHHTYNALLEDNLYRKRGWVEYSVYPLYSPQSLIAEGSANYGIEMAFPGKEKLDFERNVLYPLAGLDPKLADQYDAVSQLLSQLTYASNEVARLYINGKIDGETAAKMLQEYTLASEAKAKQRVKFYDAYGAYVINYNWGKDLVKQWVESGPDQTRQGRWARFAKLLSSPRLPATLN